MAAEQVARHVTTGYRPFLFSRYPGFLPPQPFNCPWHRTMPHEVVAHTSKCLFVHVYASAIAATYIRFGLGIQTFANMGDILCQLTSSALCARIAVRWNCSRDSSHMQGEDIGQSRRDPLDFSDIVRNLRNAQNLNYISISAPLSTIINLRITLPTGLALRLTSSSQR